MLEEDETTQPRKEEAEAPEAAVSEPEQAVAAGKNLDAIFGVKLDVKVVLGRNRLPISELLKLTRGSVIELDRRVGEPVDLMINDRLVARGDLVRVQGDLLGVALREIAKDFITEN